MPLPLAALVAGTQFAGGLVNSFSTANQNRKSREFSEKMYDKQKADNYAFWSTQNDYNSPQAQMQRFQAAGLNPNLIYGQGNSGNAGAISTPDVQTPQFRSPEWGNGVSAAGLSFVNAIYDLDIKQAQIDNLKAQNSVILQESLLKSAQTSATGASEESTRFKLGFERDLRDISADTRREQLRQIKTSTDISINRDAREAASNSTSIQEAAERMLTMRAQRSKIPFDIKFTRMETARVAQTIEQLKKDNVLRDMDIELRKMGVNPNDPMWSRVVGRFLTNIFSDDGSFKSTTGNIWSWLFGN